MGGGEEIQLLQDQDNKSTAQDFCHQEGFKNDLIQPLDIKISQNQIYDIW